MYTLHKSVRPKKLSQQKGIKNQRLNRKNGITSLLLVLVLVVLPVLALNQRFASTNNDQVDKINRMPQKFQTKSDNDSNININPTPSVNERTTTIDNTQPLTDIVCDKSGGSLIPKDMWVWQPSVASNSTERESLFTFAKSKNIQKVYLESEKLITEDQASLANFIEIAKENCIDVELLFGAADWSFTRNHGYAVSLAQKSVVFAQNAKVAPVGIQFDVEPYNTEEYKSDPNAGGNQYLDMLEKIKSVTNNSNLYFAKSLPLGFKFQSVTRNGTIVKMSDAAIDRVDRVVLMAYRDTADRVIADSAEEISYASKTGKKIVLGAETDCNTGEVETITYCEEGADYMNVELSKVYAGLQVRTAFSGIAVHDFAAYKILKP